MGTSLLFGYRSSFVVLVIADWRWVLISAKSANVLRGFLGRYIGEKVHSKKTLGRYCAVTESEARSVNYVYTV